MEKESLPTNSGGLPPLEDWQAATLRLTAFPTPDAQFAEQSWWEELMGELPKNRISHPREGRQREEGPFEKGNLALEVRPNRVDWLFTEADDQMWIESLPELLDPFLRLMLRWLEMCPPIQRLAFGAILMLPVDDLQTGYRRISAYLPSVQLDPENSSDFFYQINRRRNSTSGITGLKINRLSKWSVATLLMGKLSFGPGSVGYTSHQEQIACRLELDINTVPEFQDELPREKLSEIFQELIDLGKEIVGKGDTP